MKKTFLMLLLITTLFSACKKAPQNAIDPLPDISVEKGRLKFSSVTVYEAFTTNAEKKDVLESLKKSASFVNFKDGGPAAGDGQGLVINGCDVPDELIEDNQEFFNTLNQNGVVQIGATLYRYDYCNNKTWVLDAAEENNGPAYQDFLNGNPSSLVGVFPTYVDVTEAVAQGYRTMPDSATAAENEIFESMTLFGDRGVEYFYINNDPKDPESYNVLMDGNLQYDKFGIFFHFYGKEKYRTSCFFNWCTSSAGARDWNVKYNYTYHRKGQSNPVSGSSTIYPPLSGGENKCEKTFYQGGRGLRANRNSVTWNVNKVNTNKVKIRRGTNPQNLSTFVLYSIERYQYANNFVFPVSPYNGPFILAF